jgi:hypothetical protein
MASNPVTITKDDNGIHACINRHTAYQTVMLHSSPYCHMGATVTNLENWLTTLEVLVEDKTIPFSHRWHLQEMKAMLEVAHEQHFKDHYEVVTEAPTPEDQVAYLAAYAAAIKQGGIQ